MTTKTILYADDDPDDIMLLKDAFKSIDPAIVLIEVRNGKEALTYLSENITEQNAPSLIILDINMPLMDGKQALLQIKNKEALPAIPVIMFSTSSNQQDIEFFNKWGVTLIKKPIATSEIERIAKIFIDHCR